MTGRQRAQQSKRRFPAPSSELCRTGYVRYFSTTHFVSMQNSSKRLASAIKFQRTRTSRARRDSRRYSTVGYLIVLLVVPGSHTADKYQSESACQASRVQYFAQCAFLSISNFSRSKITHTFYFIFYFFFFFIFIFSSSSFHFGSDLLFKKSFSFLKQYCSNFKAVCFLIERAAKVVSVSNG